MIHIFRKLIFLEYKYDIEHTIWKLPKIYHDKQVGENANETAELYFNIYFWQMPHKCVMSTYRIIVFDFNIYPERRYHMKSKLISFGCFEKPRPQVYE